MWKIFIQKAKQLKRMAIRLPAICRAGGGIKLTIYKVCAIFRNEGLAGLKRKLLHTGIERNNYPLWVKQYDTLTDHDREIMKTLLKGFRETPLISVVMPVYNPNVSWLIEAIESVQKQIYQNWELCIADDASTNREIKDVLNRFAAQDQRIKVIFRENNGHISQATNSALSLVNGEWVALLDHDDLLAESALFWVAKVINENDDLQLIYSDEDKINANGIRFDPYFKCDWNKYLFYSQNMISHLGVYRTALIKNIGFREGFEGAQDYDLALRCVEHISDRQIFHIPRVLYHWRAHAESTAFSSNQKSYAAIAGEKALNEHFLRLGIKAVAHFDNFNYRVFYELPEILPLVSLIIPTRNGLNLIRQCIESIIDKTKYHNYEILIVDNGSDDPEVLAYFESLKRDHNVRVIRDERPFNYSALNNAAVEVAKGEIIGLINNDIEVISPEWLGEMVSLAVQPDVGAVGAKLWYPNDLLQHGGVVLGLGGVAGHSHKFFPKNAFGYARRLVSISEYSAVTAACLLIRKNIYKKINGLNETDLQIAFNDVDFCLRVKQAGYRNVWTPYAELYHHESASRGLENTPEKQARFEKEVNYMKTQWGSILINDPAYSFNLTLDYEDFTYAWPPRI